jgi:hypothetical protein
MWTDQFSNMLVLLVMGAMIRVSYELSGQRSSETEVITYNTAVVGANSPIDTAMTPREKEWADKAVHKYAEAQEKKWRRWNEAMFERS